MIYQVNINESLTFRNISESKDFFNCVLALYYNNLSLVQLAIKNDADPLCSNPYGSALETAVKDGEVEIVKYLLSRICASYLSNEYLTSLITLARENRHLSIVKMIEELNYYCPSHTQSNPNATDLKMGQKLKDLLLDIEKEKHQPSCYFKTIKDS